MDKILCSISTRGRYRTTLPMAIQAVIMQTKQVDKLVIFDDNDEPEDLRSDPIYSQLFQMMDIKGIPWEWAFAGKKGQHHNHQIANTMGYEWVWRVDDDAIPEPNVLQTLFSYTRTTFGQPLHSVGAVGGSILTAPLRFEDSKPTGKLVNIDTESHPQWRRVMKAEEVQHLHCSFLYRAGVHDYNLGLSRVAHREETLFSYGIYNKGYKLLVVPCVTWHLKSPTGGIRSETKEELYAHDEQIFRNVLSFKDKTVVVLDNGMGDHLVFKRLLPSLPNAEVFCCYPDIVPGRSIAEAQALFGNLDQWSIYKKMAEWKWEGSLEDAFRKLYLCY